MRAVKFVALASALIALVAVTLAAGPAPAAADPAAIADPPLVSATKAADLAQVNALLDAGTDVDVFDGDKRTALNWAAYLGALDVARTLIAHHAQIDVHANPDGWTPLMNAAAMGYVDVASVLIDKGADVNATSAIGHYTPLMYAARKGKKYMVELLLDHGARINDVDDRMWSALDFADSQPDKAIGAVLVSRGAMRGSNQ